MKFEAIKNIEKGTGEWIVTVNGTEWTDAVKKAEVHAKDNIEIPGFRKGKVPADMVKKYITDAKILQEAHRLMVRKAYDFALSQKSDVQPFSQPTPSVKKLSKDEYILAIAFDLKPEIAIKKFTGFDAIAKFPVVATEEQINNTIDQYRQRFAVYQAKDGKIAKGDTVIFDFEGFVDGKPFAGGKAEDFSLEIGSGQFIPGFEDAMIGLKTGDAKDITVNFPADYHVENLKGQPAVFKLNIKEVKTKELPEANDELVQDLNLKSVKTFADFKEHVKENIEKQLNRQEYDRFINELFRAIASDSQIAIPESIIKKEIKKLKAEFEQRVVQQKMDMKTYKRKTGMTDQMIEDTLFEDAKIRLENGVIVDYIQTQQKFEVSEDEINNEYQKLADQFNIDVATLKNGVVSEDQIKAEVANDKLFDFLYNNNGKVVSPKAATTDEKKASATKKAAPAKKAPVKK